MCSNDKTGRPSGVPRSVSMLPRDSAPARDSLLYCSLCAQAESEQLAFDGEPAVRQIETREALFAQGLRD